jgi:hypothetical protein
VWSSQLAANDFPPVCAMTGAPAETWRKFTFSTFPSWAVALLPLICLGLLPLFIGLYAVSRRATGRLPLTRASSRRVALGAGIPAGLILLAFMLGVAAVIVMAATSTSSTPSSSALVFTKWVPDALVKGGPQPGYTPSMTGLSGGDIASVTTSNDTTDGWIVNIAFTSRGSDLFATLTRDSIAACPGDPSADSKAACAQRHLTMWVGLSQTDINQWEDAGYVSTVSQPWAAGGKLVADLLNLKEVTGGKVFIFGNFSQKEAQDLAAAIQPTSTTSSSPVGSLISGVLFGLMLVTFIAAIVGLLLLRRLIGPRGIVMAPPPGYADRLVELRSVHPAFVDAVRQVQQVRAATAAPPQATMPPFPSGSN